MARAHFIDFLLDDKGEYTAGATVNVYNQDTVVAISQTIFAKDSPDVTTLANPFTTDVNGKVEFYLDTPARVDLKFTKTGFSARTVTVDVTFINPNALIPQENAVNLASRTKMNFRDGVVAVDDAGADTTHVDLDFAEDADITTQAFGDTPLASASKEVAPALHRHGMPANPITAHEGAADPHIGYRLESAQIVPANIDVSATDRLLGRDTAGAGAAEEIAPAAARTMLDVPSNAEAVLDTIVDAKGDIIVATAADVLTRLAVGANGTTLVADSAEATGLKWASGNVDPSPPLLGTPSPQSLGVELSALASVAPANAAFPVADKAFFVPFRVEETVTVVKLWQMCGSTGVGLHDIGIYDESGTRLVSIGPTANPGTATLKEYNTTDTVLTKGRYYLGIVSESVTAANGVLAWIPGIQQSKALGMLIATLADSTLPASVTFAVAVDNFVPWVGIALRTLVQ